MKEKQQEVLSEAMTENALPEVKPVRDYKDRVFRLIFKDKRKLLELYNAIHETDYTDPDEMTITTLENAIYLGMKNDISFLLHDQLSLYEHQSTNNPNMPLRNLFYISNVYSGLIKNETLHHEKLVQIPAPQFLVFYNGQQDMPERWEQKLSDAYLQGTESPSLELRTTVLNINLGKNKELAEKCYPLLEYMKYVAKVRQYRKEHSLATAVEMAVNECIHEGVLKEFLQQNKAEVIKVSIYEYDEEEFMRIVKASEREEGRKEGVQWLLKAKAVYKNLQKEKCVEVIAEELSVDKGMVEQIAAVTKEYVDKYEWEDIEDRIMEKYIIS